MNEIKYIRDGRVIIMWDFVYEAMKYIFVKGGMYVDNKNSGADS